jgi:ATP-dependent Clp protease ATP-binding subunit ClpC
VFERFTDRARRVLTYAQDEARLLNHSFIGTEHILLGLIREGQGVGAQALQSLGISLEAVRGKVEETIGMAGTAPSGAPPFTPRAKKVLELSLREALQMNHSYIGTEHLLLGLVREGEGVAATVLVSLGADLGRVRQEVVNLMTGVQEPPLPSGPAPTVVLEPCCPRCRERLSEVARYRSMAVAADSEAADPLQVDVVYCIRCGTGLHMFRGDGPG